ncbi:pyridoxal-dependent decarboxylase, partial [Escherichia coli]|uniref:pyridoxal-dependent decarboxylase n=1 Tax=Escherichia coli TaxID=562 RepID=UPI00207B7715
DGKRDQPRSRGLGDGYKGQTYTGNYEFPQPLHDALDKFQADTGIDIDMHIDAASGGFLAPFVAPDIVWD